MEPVPPLASPQQRRDTTSDRRPYTTPAYNSDDQCDCDCDCACLLGAVASRPPHPLTYYLELTPDCNNCCPGCGNVFVADKARRSPTTLVPPLDAAAWSIILDKIADHAQRLKVTGGEPTLHPEFEAIIMMIAQRGLPFTLFSNGRWVAPDRLVRLLCGVPQCLGLLISVHGATASAHEAFSGIVGSFEETCANIRYAAQAGLSIAISTVLTSQNVDQIAQVVDLARSLGARQVVFNRFLGAPVPRIALTSAQLGRAIRDVENLRCAGANVKFGACIPTCFTPSSSHGCAAGTTFVTIDPWGAVRPCNHTPLVVGNLFHQSVDEIWQPSNWTMWENMIPKQCRICDQFDSCHGGCRAMGSLTANHKDPLIGRPFVQLKN